MNTTTNDTITSNSLMGNQPCSVKVSQSNANGITFHLGENYIKASADNVVSTQNCTVLGDEKIKVALIEHFMAALAICNIKDLDVNLSNYEMPILDGSSKKWVEFFNNCNLKKADYETYSLCEPVFYTKDKTIIAVVPAESFSVTYCVDFKNGDLNNRWVTFDGTNLNEIIEARTFGYLKDLEKFQAMGLALGVTEENTVGITENGYTTELRSQYEPAKHKILDLIGDFYLTGFNPLNLKARVIAQNAGHSSHVEIAKILKNKIRLN